MDANVIQNIIENLPSGWKSETARRAKVSLRTVSKFEKGEKLRAENYQKVADAFLFVSKGFVEKQKFYETELNTVATQLH